MAGNDVTESVGSRGESIVESRLLDLGLRGKPLFRPARLGAKWPTTDLYVELLDSGLDVTPFFFIQIKSTNKGYEDPAGASKHKANVKGRLRVEIKKSDAARLAVIPAPTFLVGVEVNADREAYILAIRSGNGLNSMPIDFDLSYGNLQILHQEVLTFWKANGQKPKKSHFEV